MQFQSTHPLRGATSARRGMSARVPGYFNPRTPCGVRPPSTRSLARFPYFNPRTPCGVRPSPYSFLTCSTNFNPRTPCGVRPYHSTVCQNHRHFNPRTPCGVRLQHIKHGYHLTLFQSTHPLRGATAKMHKIFCAFCDNRQFYRVSPSGVPSVGALFTYSRGLQRARAGANLPVNGCALGLRAKASAGARLPSELRERSLFKSRRSLLAPVRAAVPFQCNSRQQRTESCPNFSA